MNMNIDLVNRALYATGHGELVREKDRENPERKPLYDLCKTFYLSTFLEALCEVPWVSGRKRKRLMRVRRPRFNSGYKNVYTLPYDCARPVELSGRGDYIIEGKYLCTDEDDAELMYVTNGRVLPRLRYAAAPEPGGEAGLVLSPGEVDEWEISTDAELDPEGPETIGDGTEPAGEETETGGDDGFLDEGDIVEDNGEDYPEYRPPRYEPKFYEYVEKMLAAKLAVKVSDNPRMHGSLLQEALMIKNDAVFASKSVAKAKKKNGEWWGDRLGLGGAV